MEPKLRPLGDRVLVRVAKTEEKQGSIIVPDAAKEKPRRGEVLAVGPGSWHDGTFTEIVGMKVGEEVLFAKYAGTEVGPDLLMLREEDLIAVMEPEPPRRQECGPMDPAFASKKYASKR